MHGGDRFVGGEGDSALSRRDFLARSASAAGVAGLALPIDKVLQLVTNTATSQLGGLPSPRNTPLDHVVVLMMENRSFDHYLGWLGDAGVADGVQDQTFLDPDGRPVSTLHFKDLAGDSDYQGCGHPDPGHGWNSGRVQLRDGFLADGSGNDIFALSYFNEGELGFIHDAAKTYTSYDRFFCSLLASTWPNRYYKWSGQSGGRMNNDPPLDTLGNQWETIFDRALGKGVSARYYNSDLPFSAVWGARGATWTNPIARYYADCALGTLPSISFVDPPFRDGGGFDGLSADEHPLGDVRLGQAFMADVVQAFVESPCYRRGALFIVYDEWGGFFDHVKPPSVPDARATPGNLDTDFGQMGFRVPAVAISPYTRRKSGDPPRVGHGVYGFESILKLISYRWGLGSLTTRDAQAGNIGESFDWANPDRVPPDLPNPVHIASKPCGLGGGDLLPESIQEHISDLADLEELALRFNIKVGDGKASDILRLPDSVQAAIKLSL